ncbi:uncharacterized protein P884DRAFT_319977 [Thermothelomyces heterothallicus CBS 202.75]|uniref:uncharacterized protein n=1 Tax=Thermothelomyces heterothallicus CBS 202.75 TaxID=1149848 RepID=UPI0037427470
MGEVSWRKIYHSYSLDRPSHTLKSVDMDDLEPHEIAPLGPPQRASPAQSVEESFYTAGSPNLQQQQAGHVGHTAARQGIAQLAPSRHTHNQQHPASSKRPLCLNENSVSRGYSRRRIAPENRLIATPSEAMARARAEFGNDPDMMRKISLQVARFHRGIGYTKNGQQKTFVYNNKGEGNAAITAMLGELYCSYKADVFVPAGVPVGPGGVSINATRRHAEQLERRVVNLEGRSGDTDGQLRQLERKMRKEFGNVMDQKRLEFQDAIVRESVATTERIM